VKAIKHIGPHSGERNGTHDISAPLSLEVGKEKIFKTAKKASRYTGEEVGSTLELGKISRLLEGEKEAPLACIYGGKPGAEGGGHNCDH